MTPLGDQEHERRDSYFDNEVTIGDSASLGADIAVPEEESKKEIENPSIASLRSETYHLSSDNLIVNL
jgi:hypothetical protein